MYIQLLPEENDPPKKDDFLITILWLLILIIVIIMSLTGYTAYRKYTGNYTVEEIFWIFDNGLLINHLSTDANSNLTDREIVGGMLTAILDFSEDAFNKNDLIDSKVKIKEIQMMEKNILVERGNYTFLATVFNGRSGKKLYIKSQKTMHTLESKYRKVLISWKGEKEQLTGARTILKEMLPVAVEDPKLKK
jgi:hypothetical protein